MKINHKIIVGGSDKLFYELSQELEANEFTVIQTRNNTLDILYDSINNQPIACILSADVNQPESLIDNLLKIDPKPHIYIITPRFMKLPSSLSEHNPYVTTLQQPISVRGTVSMITEQIDNRHLESVNQAEYMNQLHNYVSEILTKLCITPNYNGFIYLREAIKMAVLEPINSRSFSKCVYPRLSQLYNSSPASIERNIRTVILKGWQKASLSDKSDIFGTYAVKSGWHPTNGEVILIVADKVQRTLSKTMKLAN